MKNWLGAILGLVFLALALGAAVYFLPQRKTEPQIVSNSDVSLGKQDPVSELASVSGVVSRGVNYFESRNGFYAEPEKSGSYPGVVMIHEWWGLNDNIREMAAELARHGYKVLAVDLFGSVAVTPDEARAGVAALNQEKALENLKAAVAYLRSRGATSVGSLGWCFGGGQSMQLALAGEDLAATVIYYGNLVVDAGKLKDIKWPVLGIFGEKDQSVKAETVREFDAALDVAGVKNAIYIYPGVGHAFANPSGDNYAPNETRDAWDKTLKFLKENLK